MPMTVWSLNGGRFVGKTPDEEPQTVKWLKHLSEPGAIVPDVLCLQDFRVSSLQYLRPLPHFHFAPMTNHSVWDRRELVGICIASKYPIDAIAIHHTWGDGMIRDLVGVGPDNQRAEPHEIADKTILETENRVALACTVMNPGEPRMRIATHHGFWVRGGMPSPGQIQSTASLCEFLSDQACEHGGLVYAADCNPDRQGNVIRMYYLSGGRDYLPDSIKTTVTENHPAAKFGAKPDHIMIWPDSLGNCPYDVTDVHMDDSPGSDHLMLCCTLVQKT